MNLLDEEKALIFAGKKHAGQFRIYGHKPYIVHPVTVASLVRKYKKDEEDIDSLVIAAILHDVLELPNTTYYELVREFGVLVASLVSEVTTNREMKEAIGKKKYLAYKLMHMTHWALVIKLCDRLHNMSDYELWDESFRCRKVDETEFILDYLEKNREELTLTHKAIIKDIRELLEKAKEISVAPELKLIK